MIDIDKARVCAPLLGTPGCEAFTEAIDELEEARKEIMDQNLKIIKLRAQVWEHRDRIDELEAKILEN